MGENVLLYQRMNERRKKKDFKLITQSKLILLSAFIYDMEKKRTHYQNGKTKEL